MSISTSIHRREQGENGRTPGFFFSSSGNSDDFTSRCLACDGTAAQTSLSGHAHAASACIALSPTTRPLNSRRCCPRITGCNLRSRCETSKRDIILQSMLTTRPLPPVYSPTPRLKGRGLVVLSPNPDHGPRLPFTHNRNRL